jgi:hypothetical protein
VKAQPVPPVFQPELAADAIVWVCDHPRREVRVGFPTLMAIEADKIAPGLLDRYLAQSAFDGQQTEEPEDPYRPNNLWHPVPGDHGAHGAFGDRARRTSAQLFLTTHRAAIVGVLAASAVAYTAWTQASRRASAPAPEDSR